MPFSFLQFINYKTTSFWDVKRLLFSFALNSNYPLVKFSDLISPRKEKIKKDEYDNITPVIAKISFNDGLIHLRADKKTGMDLYRVDVGDFIVSNINFHQGASAINNIGVLVCSTHYQPYIIDKNKIVPEFLALLVRTPKFFSYISNQKVNGIKTESNFNFLKDIEIPVPPLEKQKEIVSQYYKKADEAKILEKRVENTNFEIEQYVTDVLGLKIKSKGKKSSNLLDFINFSEIDRWDISNEISLNNFLNSSKFPMSKLGAIVDVNPRTNIERPPEDTVSFVPMTIVSEEYGSIENHLEKEVSNSKGYTKFKEGDLIWAKITPCMQNGKSAIATNLKNGFGFGSTEFHVIRNFSPKLIDTKYLHYFLRLPVVLKQAMATFTGSAGQQRVPASFLEELKVPLPPLSLQNKIVDDISAMIDKVVTYKEKARDLINSAKSEFEKEIFL